MDNINELNTRLNELIEKYQNLSNFEPAELEAAWKEIDEIKNKSYEILSNMLIGLTRDSNGRFLARNSMVIDIHEIAELANSVDKISDRAYYEIARINSPERTDYPPYSEYNQPVDMPEVNELNTRLSELIEKYQNLDGLSVSELEAAWKEIDVLKNEANALAFSKLDGMTRNSNGRFISKDNREIDFYELAQFTSEIDKITDKAYSEISRIAAVENQKKEKDEAEKEARKNFIFETGRRVIDLRRKIRTNEFEISKLENEISDLRRQLGDPGLTPEMIADLASRGIQYTPSQKNLTPEQIAKRKTLTTILNAKLEELGFLRDINNQYKNEEALLTEQIKSVQNGEPIPTNDPVNNVQNDVPALNNDPVNNVQNGPSVVNTPIDSGTNNQSPSDLDQLDSGVQPPVPPIPPFPSNDSQLDGPSDIGNSGTNDGGNNSSSSDSNSGNNDTSNSTGSDDSNPTNPDNDNDLQNTGDGLGGSNGDDPSNDTDQDLDDQDTPKLPVVKGNNPKITWKTVAATAVGIGIGAGVFFAAGPMGVGIMTLTGKLAKVIINKKINNLSQVQQLGENIDVQDISEPQPGLKGAFTKFTNYLKSEEGLRDMKWMINAAIVTGSALTVASSIQNMLNPEPPVPVEPVPDSPIPDPTLPEPVVDIPETDILGYDDITLGGNVDGFNISTGHDTANWAVNNVNTEILNGKYVTGDSIFHRFASINPDGSVGQIIDTRGLSLAEFCAQNGLDPSQIAVDVANAQGSSQAWISADQLLNIGGPKI